MSTPATFTVPPMPMPSALSFFSCGGQPDLVQGHQRGPGLLADGKAVAQVVAVVMADDDDVGAVDILGPQGRLGIAAQERIDENDPAPLESSGPNARAR